MGLVDKFKKTGMSSVLGIGLVTPLLTGCIAEQAGEWALNVPNMLGGRPTTFDQREAEERQRIANFKTGEVEFFGEFGKTYACFAAGNTNPSNPGSNKSNFIGIGNVNPNWFYLRTTEIFGNPRMITYDSNMREIDSSSLGGIMTVMGGQLHYAGTQPAGNYTLVVVGQKIRLGLTQSMARGIGEHKKIIEIPFTLR